VELALGDTVLYSGSPVHDTFPFSEWIAGQVLVDRYDPRLGLGIPPGDYALRLRLTDPMVGTAHVLDIDLETITVQRVDRSFEIPAVSHRVEANLSDQAELLGYDLSADSAIAGDTVVLTLYWRALSEMDEDYTVFVHLLTAAGTIVGQHDGQPVGGTYPTSLWMPGEVVEDSHEFVIQPESPPGEQWLEVGLYIADTGERLIEGASGEDALRIQPIAIRGP
jgi:hypothetical protein